LFRLIFAEILEEKYYLYPPRTIIIIIKPLYGIPESGIYWFATYNKYYIEELLITISFHDLCLFISTTKKLFVILVIQTNNILFLVNKQFADLEKKKQKEKGYTTKPREILNLENPFIFNRNIISQEKNNLVLRQK
jgi:hypothetical protein